MEYDAAPDEQKRRFSNETKTVVAQRRANRRAFLSTTDRDLRRFD